MRQSVVCGTKRLIQGEKTYVMGIVNVTPDSFSDGGLWIDTQKAIAWAHRLIVEGADIIDIGGVSTAPNAPFVSVQEELDRVMPVIEGLVKDGVRCISVDTMQAQVAKAALSLGASWINDESAGLFDPAMSSVMKNADAVVLMHRSGDSGVDAGEHVVYEDVIETLYDFFAARIKNLTDCGVDGSKLILDPGVGFGKGLDDTITIITNMHRFKTLNCMTLLGLSRKSFLGKLSGIKEPCERDFVSLGAQAMAVVSGVNIVRTHNVRAAVDMLKALDPMLAMRMRTSDENLHEAR